MDGEMRVPRVPRFYYFPFLFSIFSFFDPTFEMKVRFSCAARRHDIISWMSFSNDVD